MTPWWKTDTEEKPKEKEVVMSDFDRKMMRKHAGQGCWYCTFNIHYDCVSTPGGCEQYLWNGKEPTLQYCDDCRVAEKCNVKKLREKRDIPIGYCGYWLEIKKAGK